MAEITVIVNKTGVRRSRLRLAGQVNVGQDRRDMAFMHGASEAQGCRRLLLEHPARIDGVGIHRIDGAAPDRRHHVRRPGEMIMPPGVI